MSEKMTAREILAKRIELQASLDALPMPVLKNRHGEVIVGFGDRLVSPPTVYIAGTRHDEGRAIKIAKFILVQTGEDSLLTEACRILRRTIERDQKDATARTETLDFLAAHDPQEAPTDDEG